MLTHKAEDACSWVTYERACEAARLASQFFKYPAFIHHSEANQWQ